MSIALWILGVVGYFNTGYWWGKFNSKTWEKREQSTKSFLCFPITHSYGEVGNGPTPFAKYWDINELSEESYAKILAFTWPTKLAFNLVLIAFFSALFIGKTTVKLTTYPISLFPKRAPKELTAAPPAEPTPIQSDSYSESKADEYELILARHRNDEIRLQQLEAELDENRKIVSLPKRL